MFTVIETYLLTPVQPVLKIQCKFLAQSYCILMSGKIPNNRQYRLCTPHRHKWSVIRHSFDMTVSKFASDQDKDLSILLKDNSVANSIKHLIAYVLARPRFLRSKTELQSCGCLFCVTIPKLNRYLRSPTVDSRSSSRDPFSIYNELTSENGSQRYTIPPLNGSNLTGRAAFVRLSERLAIFKGNS